MPEQPNLQAGGAVGDIGETVQVTEGPDKFSTQVDMFEAIASMTPNDLLKMLDTRHPLYDQHSKTWQRLGDVALNRIDTDAEKRRYLIKGKSEQDRQFKERVEMSAFLPETPGLVSDFIGAVYSKSARREFDEDADATIMDTLTAFWNAADLDGNHISEVTREAAALAIIYGFVDGVLDHPADAETDIPFTTLYTPDQRLDWQLDDDGGYAWVKYKETRSEKTDWAGGRESVEEYRIITPTEILYFKVTGKKSKRQVTEQEVIPHQFASIPVRTLYWKRDDEGIGISWARPMVEADIKAFRIESDLIYDTYLHAHPTLALWLHNKTGSDNPIDSLDYGGAYAVLLNPGDRDANLEKEDVSYVAPMTADLEFQAQLAQDTREEARRLAANGAETKQGTGTQAKSGVALAYEQATRSKNFVQLSRALQEWEWQLNELVAGEFGRDTSKISDQLEVIYPDSFDQRLIDELHQDLDTAKRIGSATLVKELKKTIAAKLLGDGATSSTLEAIQQEIEDQAEDIGGGTPTEEGTLNAQAMAIARLVEIGDFELANDLRKLLASEHGLPEPSEFRGKQEATAAPGFPPPQVTQISGMNAEDEE